jgi:hypothetical protein
MNTGPTASPNSTRALSRDVAETLRFEQVKLAYDQLTNSQLVAVLNAVVFIAVQCLVIAPPVLLSWLSAVCLLALVRIAGGSAFRRAAPQSAEIRRWRAYFIAGATASGIVWGSAAVFLYPPINAAHQVFVAFMVGGMVAGSVTTLAPVFPAFVVFANLALVPVVIRFTSQQDAVSYAMGWMALVFLVSVIVIAHRSQRGLSDMLLLRIQNARLVGEVLAMQGRLARLQEEAEALRRGGR